MTDAERHLVLVGMMGVGKSSVGRRLALRLGRPFVDTDRLVEEQAGKSVPEIFAEDGEPAFRALEAEAVRAALDSPAWAVVAFGGGAVLDPANRDRAREAGLVVWLQAPPRELARRVAAGQRRSGGTARPLLVEGSPEPTHGVPQTPGARGVPDILQAIAAGREESYKAAAHILIDTAGRLSRPGRQRRPAGHGLDLPGMKARTVAVELGARRYEVTVGAGVLGGAADALAGRSRVAVVSQPAVAERWAPPLTAALTAAGVETELFLMGEGEEAKSLATVEDLCRRFAAWGLLRADAVVALGGGVVGDTAGFTAAAYHRGVACLQAPTTLLAQVDAAIGGKTGVNLPEGKNLVGAFHQPVAVVADVDTLATLPEREYRAGLGEVAKYALMSGTGPDPGMSGTGPDPGMGDAGLTARLSSAEGAAALLARQPDTLVDVVAACAAIKAAVVGADEHERTGLRATLNYGHTLAHALETAGHYDLLHGEAVSVGLVFATELAGALGRLDAAAVGRTREMLAALGLPVTAPAGVTTAELLALMRRDKKASGGLTFVLPAVGGGSLERVDDPPAPAVEQALAAVGITI